MSLLITVCSIALVAGGIYVLTVKYGGRKISLNSKRVDCIKYEDLYEFFISDRIQNKLRENKNLKLLAKKQDVEIEGKKLFYVSMMFFDSSKSDYVKIEDSLNLLSEKLDDFLTEKFSGINNSLFMRSEIL